MSVNKDFIIFSLPNCPYCELAVTLLKEKDANFLKLSVDDTADSKIDKNLLKKNISTMINKEVKTFPIIFTSEMEFIGGYDDLEYYIHYLY